MEDTAYDHLYLASEDAALHPGRIEVRVEVKETRAAITVRDSGRGIDPAFLPAVFDRFSQAESVSSRSAGGLGLGLAIVRSIVELHGGEVTADSEGLGKG